jgi:hypothetical protein
MMTISMGVRLHLRTAATNRLIVHPQVIYEYREPQWNDTDRGKLLIHPSELSGNPISSHLVAKQEEIGEGNDEFCLQTISFRKILWHLAKSFTSPLKEGVLCIFITLKNPSP